MRSRVPSVSEPIPEDPRVAPRKATAAPGTASAPRASDAGRKAAAGPLKARAASREAAAAQHDPLPSPLAAALDSVGDRWTLLLVEALLGGPRRFGDLQEGLIGLGIRLSKWKSAGHR